MGSGAAEDRTNSSGPLRADQRSSYSQSQEVKEDSADAERIPEFFAAIGPDGPVGYATNVSIEETNDPATGHPRSIAVTGRSSSLDVAMELTVDEAIVTNRGAGLFVGELDFLQLRAGYRVRGRAGDRSIDFSTSGAAETFRGRVRR